MWAIELLRQGAHDFRARRVGQPLELAQVFVERLPRAGPLERRSDKERPLDWRGDVDQFA